MSVLPAKSAVMLAWINEEMDRDDDRRADIACGGFRSRGVTAGLNTSTDTDGDGQSNADDSCPTTYNPCQWGTDIDGDGAGVRPRIGRAPSAMARSRRGLPHAAVLRW